MDYCGIRITFFYSLSRVCLYIALNWGHLYTAFLVLSSWISFCACMFFFSPLVFCMVLSLVSFHKSPRPLQLFLAFFFTCRYVFSLSLSTKVSISSHGSVSFTHAISVLYENKFFMHLFLVTFIPPLSYPLILNP